MKLRRLVADICRLARAVYEHEWAEIEKRHPGALFVPVSVYVDLPEAPQHRELRALVHAQAPATLYTLVLLWRLGRGDFSPRSDLRSEYLEISDSFRDVRAAGDYLLGKILPRYLEEGLRHLARARVDVDRLLD